MEDINPKFKFSSRKEYEAFLIELTQTEDMSDSQQEEYDAIVEEYILFCTNEKQ